MAKLIEVSAIPPQLYRAVETQTGYSYKGTKISVPSELRREGEEDKYEEIKPSARKLVCTILKVIKFDGTYVEHHLPIRWFNQEEIEYTGIAGSYKDGSLITDMTDFDMLQNITAAWEVPDEYINILNESWYVPTTELDYGGINEVSSTCQSGSASYTANGSILGVIYNAKAKYCQSVKIRVYNPASGEQMEKNIYDLLPNGTDPESETITMSYHIVADIRPNGCPIFCWDYNDGGTSQLDKPCEFLRGGSWAKSYIIANGVPGSYFEQLAINQAKDLNKIGLVANLGSGAMNLVTSGMYGSNIGTAFAAQQIFGSVSEYIMKSVQLSQQQEMLNRKAISASRPLSLSTSDYFKDVSLNKFYYVISKYNDEDMYNYDKFLTCYGYNVGSMRIGTQHFYSRRAFNYIRVNDITIYSDIVGQEMLNKVTTQLQAGVRIWHVKPNWLEMEPFGNRETAPVDDKGVKKWVKEK